MGHSSSNGCRTWLCIIACLALVALPVLTQQAASIAYTPVKVQCPPGTLVRSAGTTSQRLSAQETAYIGARTSQVLPAAWSSYLSNLKNYAATQRLPLPTYAQTLLGGGGVPKGLTLGIAVSGGGYRAAVVGGGILNALDVRNGTSALAGTGGLLQGATYLSGLSGGAWLVSSLTQAGFPLIQNHIFGRYSSNSSGENDDYGGFLAQYDFIDPSGNSIIDAEYLFEVVEETLGKSSAGLEVTFTDVWARVLSRHFANGTNSNNFFNSSVKHGAGLLWSDVTST